jgi:AcrR family transcriptional regulator
MPETAAPDSRRVTAERNVEAILDAAQGLLRRGKQPSISAVASDAGVSRPTVYAHFPDRGELLAALVKRTVQEAMGAIGQAEPERGPAPEALQRLISASWRQVADHEAIARAAAAELSAGAMRAAHESARDVIQRLVERGRSEGSFRTDVPAGWLVTASLALVHATAEEVRLDRLDAERGLQALSLAVADLFRDRTRPLPH